MLDTVKILDAIDAFSTKQTEDRHEVHIPAEDGKPRKYLGLSALGKPCHREVWYTWRHCQLPVFPPRLFRLFRRGHREEYVFVYLLRGIGMTIHTADAEGKQFRVTDYEGHLSGHLDGVGEAPLKYWVKGHKPTPFLTEYKSYNKDRFNKLRKEGLKKSDPKYYAQIQCYMGYEGLKGCLFCAVNKNDDDLFFKWFPFNQKDFDSLVAKGGEIISAQKPPLRISNNASWFECKFCDFHAICHKGESSLKSCRSCKFAEPGPAKSWSCTRGGTYGKLCTEYKDIAH